MYREKVSLFFLVLIPIIFVDQLSKRILAGLPTATCNSGIAFGLLPNFFSDLFFLLVLGVIFFGFFSARKKVYEVGFLFLSAGGLSNLIDRVFRHCVLDFINVGFWPSFNIADSFITIGVAILLWQYFLEKK